MIRILHSVCMFHMRQANVPFRIADRKCDIIAAECGAETIDEMHELMKESVGG